MDSSTLPIHITSMNASLFSDSFCVWCLAIMLDVLGGRAAAES
jgi:hypothetical protein